MPFRQIIAAVSDLMPKLHLHPFNTQLAAGTLRSTLFLSYLEQDQIYLRAFAKALQQTGTRLASKEHQQVFYIFAHDMMDTESNMQRKYLLPIHPSAFFAPKNVVAQAHPVVQKYIDHITYNSIHAPIHLAVASLTPCFYVYNELGIAMQKQGITAHNPYAAWINTYTSPSANLYTQQMMRILKELGAPLHRKERQKMALTFRISTQHELSFFDCSYNPQTPEIAFNHH